MFRVGFSCSAGAPNNSLFRWTALLLVAFSFVITCRLLAGDSFSCYHPESKVPQSHLNMLCYSGSVYFEPGQDLEDRRSEQESAVSDKPYIKHYAWVNLLLLVQAFIFCLPHLIWSNLERGYLKKLPFLNHGLSRTDSERDAESRMQLLARHFPAMTSHRNYVFCNNLMHLGRFIVSILQTVWLRRFFQVNEMSEIPAIGSDSMSRFSELYFPQSGDCDVRIHSNSGDTTVKCLLPLNQLYMYIFLFLYVWYIFLAVICGFVVFTIVLMRLSSRLRQLTFSNVIRKSVIRSICDRLSYYDWFIMKQLSDNLSDMEFKKLTDILCNMQDMDREDPPPLLRDKSIPTEFRLETQEEADL